MASVKLEQQIQSGDTHSRPVFLFIDNPDVANSIAADLRDHGLRVRSFVHADVLNNAARNEAPLAIIMDVDAIRADGSLPVNLDTSDARPALLFLGQDTNFADRLRAVRAGGDGYYSDPVNHPALLHQLNALSSAATAQAQRIVIVDGPDQALQETRTVLAQAGFQTVYLDDPQHILAALRQEPCQLLLLCHELDDMLGTELLTLIRQSLRFQALPTILLTQRDKRQIDAAAAAAGVDVMLSLPVAPTDLKAVVRAQLKRAQQLIDAHQFCTQRDPDDGLFTRNYFMDALRQAVADPGTSQNRAALLWLEAETDISAQIANTLLQHLPPQALASRMSDRAVAILLPAFSPDERTIVLNDLDQQLTQSSDQHYDLGTILLTGRHRTAIQALEAAHQAANQSPDKTEPASKPSMRLMGPDATEVSAALRENRFRLVYQPIASLSGQPTSYYEVFLRMKAHDGSDILPQEFLAAAAGNLAEQLDRWVLSEALHVLESQQTLRDKPTLFVKLFPDSISAGPELLRWLSDTLRLAQLEPSRLALQLTQQCAQSRPTETQSFITAAKQLGCQIVLEHFSAGGELGQQLLQTLQPHFVRLAPEITRDISNNRDHQKLTEMIAGQCRAIGAKPIAALVQDALNLSMLWRCGIEYIQGYFMQEPVDVFSDTEMLPDS